MNPSHRALREATAAAHDRVDAAFAGFDLTDRAAYARFLHAQAAILLPLEAELPGGRIVADWPARHRGPLLREDLAQLPRPAARDDPARPLTLDWSRDSVVAGVLYVLEGSRLGGRFLARGLPTGFPREFLNAPQGPEKWQQLLADIHASLQNPSELTQAIAAADAAFAAFERSAQRWL